MLSCFTNLPLIIQTIQPTRFVLQRPPCNPAASLTHGPTLCTRQLLEKTWAWWREYTRSSEHWGAAACQSGPVSGDEASRHLRGKRPSDVSADDHGPQLCPSITVQTAAGCGHCLLMCRRVNNRPTCVLWAGIIVALFGSVFKMSGQR